MSIPPTDGYEAQVVAPSRLHFGLLAPAGAGERRFGGLGAMIDEPGLRLKVQLADHLSAHGPLAERAALFARRVAACCGWNGDPPCRIDVESAPPEHVGLGSGTQLGLAVAAAVGPLLTGRQADVAQMADWVGRGARSAIGTHGFAEGGLLFERGKFAQDAVAPLAARVDIPAAWRFVLFWPDVQRGLSGEAEVAAFRQLEEVPADVTAQLTRIASDEAIPAAAATDLDRFGEALYRFGHTAGLSFARCQTGPFASEAVANLVATIRGLGVAGTGQSSWGPTVFAVVANDEAANELVKQIRGRQPGAGPANAKLEKLRWLIVRPNNSGAVVKIRNFFDRSDRPR